uniref:Uncharacterized protein n=1 Tax=Salix viminalis TaxID=40686 RepID=A0A6N2LZ80_SALVM
MAALLQMGGTLAVDLMILHYQRMVPVHFNAAKLCISKLGSLCALEKWKPVRFLSSGGALRSASEFLEEEELNSKENEDDLKGNAVSASELRHISKELRMSQRFKHALEVRLMLIFCSFWKFFRYPFLLDAYKRQHNWWVDIALKLKNLCLNISEWMVTHEEFELSDTDHASRIDLMTKVFGVDAAERYFDSLPLAAKTTETTLLSSTLCCSKMIESEMMIKLSFSSHLEKVSQVVEELKHQKVAPISSLTISG